MLFRLFKTDRAPEAQTDIEKILGVDEDNGDYYFDVLQRDLLQSFKLEYIFWFNRCLQQLFNERFDLCTKFIQKQITYDIDRDIASLLHSLIHHQTPPEEILIPKNAGGQSESFITTLSSISVTQFTNLLRFNEHLVQILNLDRYHVKYNPLDPHICFNIFEKQLKKTNLTAQEQHQLRCRFAQIIAIRIEQLINSCCAEFIRYATEKRAERRLESTCKSSSNQSNIADHLTKHRNQLHDNLKKITAESKHYIHEAVTRIVPEHGLPEPLKPLLQVWERYLFKVYLEVGTNGDDWSNALTIVADLYRLTKMDYTSLSDSEEHKEHLQMGLKSLIAEIQSGLDQIGLSNDEIIELTDALEAYAFVRLYVKEADSQ